MKGKTMTLEQIQKSKKVMQMVQQDMKDDAASFDGKPFNGRTMAEYNGNLGAAVAAVARTLEMILSEMEQ